MLILPPLQVSANIALEAFLIHPSNFLGLSCTALQRPTLSLAASLPDKYGSGQSSAAMESLLNFKCHTVNSSGSPASQLSKVRSQLANGMNLYLTQAFPLICNYIIT